MPLDVRVRESRIQIESAPLFRPTRKAPASLRISFGMTRRPPRRVRSNSRSNNRNFNSDSRKLKRNSRRLNRDSRKLNSESRQTHRHGGYDRQGITSTERQRIEEGAYTGVYAPSPLKDQLQRKLDDAIVAGRQSVVAADIAGDLPEVWRIERNATANIAHAGHS